MLCNIVNNNQELVERFASEILMNGIDISIDTQPDPIKVIFKSTTDRSISSNKNKENFLTVFAERNTIPIGSIITLASGDKYLVSRDNTNENTVYDKFHCLQCNQTIKYELRHKDDETKADLTTFYVNADNIRTTVDEAIIITSSSKAHFTFPLNDLTKRILVNDRFFAGSKWGIWKIIDLNYQNNLCEVYCEKDIRDANVDDIENLIADRWLIENKPDTYNVSIAEDTLSVIVGNKIKPTVTVKRNNMDYTPIVTNYIYSALDETIVSADTATGELTGLKVGTTTVYIDYKEETNDISQGDSIQFTVTEIPPDDYVLSSAQTDVSIIKGNTQQLTITATKNDSAYTLTNPIEWNNTNPTIATIDDNNLISGLNIGTTVLTGVYKEKANDNCVPVVINVEVADIPKDTYRTDIIDTDFTMNVNETKTLNVKVYKNDVEIIPTPTVAWTIADNTIISISDNVVTGLTAGESNITASYKATENDIAITDTIKATVVSAPSRIIKALYSECPTVKINGGDIWAKLPMLGQTVMPKNTSGYTTATLPASIHIIEETTGVWKEEPVLNLDETITNDVPYNSTYQGISCFRLRQNATQVINFSKASVSNPVWKITLSVSQKDIDLIQSSKKFVDYTIDNTTGKITIMCVSFSGLNTVIYVDVVEQTSGTYNRYAIRLASAF